MIPSTTWLDNVRSNTTKTQWDKIRRNAYDRAKYRCEICGGQGINHPVECHEIWKYDHKNHIQKLAGFIALCPDCHEVKHIGLAIKKNQLGRAIKHLAKVNQWTVKASNAYCERTMIEWENKSRHYWTVDLSELHKYI